MDTIIAVVNARGVLNNVVDSNIEILEEEGFLIADKRKLVLDHNVAMQLNLEDSEEEVKLFVSGPVVVLKLKRRNAFDVMHNIYPQLTDLYYTHTPYLALHDERMLLAREPLLERTLAVVKPGYTQEDLSTIIDSITENNFVILERMTRALSADVAAQIVGRDNHADIVLLTKGTSVILVLEKLGAVDDWLLLLGPEDPEEARLHAPYSLRARLGTDLVNNVAYGSPSVSKAAQDVASQFQHPFPLERSVLLVKPDAVQHAHLIVDALKAHGFTVLAQDRLSLSKTRVESLYQHLRTQPYFQELVAYMSTGDVVPILVSKPAAVASLRALAGPSDPAVALVYAPRSLRARFATDKLRNAVDASADAVAVTADIAAFFPRLAADHVPTPNEVEILLSKRTSKFRPGSTTPASLKDVLAEGLAQLCKVKPTGDVAAVRWLANWLLRNNPSKPQVEEPEDSDVEDGVPDVTPANVLSLKPLPTSKSSSSSSTSTSTSTSSSTSTSTSSAAGKVKVDVLPVKDVREILVVTGDDDDDVASSEAKSHKAGSKASSSSMDPARYQTGARVVSVTAPAKAPRLIWALGAPGTGEDALLPAIAAGLRADVVHVPSLLAAAEAQSTEYGRVLAQHRRLGRSPPSHMIVSLIQQALEQAGTGAAGGEGAGGAVLAQFPLSLDDAFAAEKTFGPPALVLALHCGEEAAAARLSKQSQLPRADLLAQSREYVESVAPVVEHYQTFGKVLPVSTDDTQVATGTFLKHEVIPQITSALKAAEPRERAPKKKPLVPKKKAPVVVDEGY